MRKIYTKHGVALPIMEDGFDSPQTIINAHIQKCQKHGKAYFSTSYATNGKKLKALDSVLLYNVTQGIYYIAEVETAIGYGKKRDVPADAADFSPKQYANVPEKTWLLIKNIKKVQLQDLATYYFNGTPVDKHLQTTKRWNRFYYAYK